jgi:uncharacterized protein
MRIPMIARAMTTQPKADAVEPFKLARKGAAWTGEIPLAALPRLSAEVAHGAAGSLSDVAVALRFFCDEQGRARVRGHASTTVGLSCQRCLEPVLRELEIEIDLWLVRTDEQAQRLSPEQEPCVLWDERVAVAVLVEDDLLLALPEQVCLNFDDCANAPALAYPAPVRAGTECPAASGRRKPFETLARLKQYGGRDES